jgi:hypothetical protein
VSRRDGDDLDRHYTPREVAQAVVRAIGVRPGQTAIEPSCGGGAFVDALLEAGLAVDGVDLDPEAPGLQRVQRGHVRDFGGVLCPEDLGATARYDWAIMNPPFRAVDAHLAAAMRVARRVAMVVRVTWLGARERSGDLEAMRPDRVIMPTPRPSFSSSGGTDQAPVVVVVWYRVGSPAARTDFELLPWRDVRSGRQDQGLALQGARYAWLAAGEAE